ncbi:MAG: hypothetical protein LBK26_00130 [Rickettsiales bacterium]|jgi:hypothetical protein|nr:hypothetical protein [Rickettsiales bacterium]
MQWRYLFLFSVLFIPRMASAENSDFEDALLNSRVNCAGIYSEISDIKKMAGINTAVTGVGTVAGAGALYAGIKKSQTDKLAEQLESQIKNLETMSDEEFLAFLGGLAELKNAQASEKAAQLADATRESKNLGNWRTGLMAGNTATNIAGAIIAAKNKVNGDVRKMIENCRESVDALDKMIPKATFEGFDVKKAKEIVNTCGKYKYLDISKINNRADVAKWAAIAGGTFGAAGTVTSAVANTNNTRNDNSASGKKVENNLNTASNILAGAATAGSGVATVFNAIQISAANKAADIAKNCEGVLE